MNKIIIDIFIKLAPIFILIGLGVWIRHIKLFKEEAVEDFKKLIINISLPAILFFAFLNIELKISYIFIFIIMFILCIILYLTGFIIKIIFNMQSEYIPFLLTGFEFGMMGAVFFGAAFGLENMGYIGLIGLGHEFFIWFIYVTLLKRQMENKNSILTTLRSFITSPVIIAIVFGILLNLLSLKNILENFFLTESIFQSLKYLTGLTVPLILIIIGYNIRFDFHLFRNGVSLIIIRLILILFFVVLIDFFIFKKLLHLDKIFSAALFTFAILPPPFILPLFIKKEKTGEIAYVNGILLLYSIFSILIFTIYFIIYSSNLVN